MSDLEAKYDLGPLHNYFRECQIKDIHLLTFDLGGHLSSKRHLQHLKFCLYTQYFPTI